MDFGCIGKPQVSSERTFRANHAFTRVSASGSSGNSTGGFDPRFRALTIAGPEARQALPSAAVAAWRLDIGDDGHRSLFE
jgi:hypothetical protein